MVQTNGKLGLHGGGGGGGESVLSLVLLTMTRLNSVYHLIIYSGDNIERSLYERRH